MTQTTREQIRHHYEAHWLTAATNGGGEQMRQGYAPDPQRLGRPHDYQSADRFSRRLSPVIKRDTRCSKCGGSLGERYSIVSGEGVLCSSCRSASRATSTPSLTCARCCEPIAAVLGQERVGDKVYHGSCAIVVRAQQRASTRRDSPLTEKRVIGTIGGIGTTFDPAGYTMLA